MNHKKLVQKIQSNYEENKHFRDQPDWKSFAALRAVVELHKPQLDHCPCCPPVLCECAEVYPCPTIKAIEKKLS